MAMMQRHTMNSIVKVLILKTINCRGYRNRYPTHTAWSLCERHILQSFFDKLWEDTINKDYDTSFTWETLANYYESGINIKWDNLLGSDTALRTIGQLQKNKKKVLKEIENTEKKHIQVDDEMLQITVDKALNDSQLDIASLF